MKNLQELQSISDQFFSTCEDVLQAHPWAVCTAMHEYARNLYPEDPYIPFSPEMCPTERLYSVTERLISFLSQCQGLGHYQFFPEFNAEEEEVKAKTGEVYGQLWEQFSFEDLTQNAINILKERWEPNGFFSENLTGKSAIDIGCGSGRFSFALGRMGCKDVVGVDYGDRGLKVARQTADSAAVTNVTFHKADVLDLPFEDEQFDFVFCHGVLHHTNNMEQGMREMIRVAKKGSPIWWYIYGAGGIFWYARKKMPLVMKKIPQAYTLRVLKMIGMPSNRFVFADNWYVPIERHTTDKEARQLLAEMGISSIKRKEKGRATDLDFMALNGGEPGRIMWGDGELSYFLEK